MPIDEITFRTELRPGDIGYIIFLHGSIYSAEYGYGMSFERYVTVGLYEFMDQYDPEKDQMWLCEHKGQIIGSLALMHRENNAAQLRYFVLKPEYRKMGLGKKLMNLFMDFLKSHGYTSAYLWTTNEQKEAAALYKKFGFVKTADMVSTTFGKEVTEQRYDLVL